jgi:hypothetical protein
MQLGEALQLLLLLLLYVCLLLCPHAGADATAATGIAPLVAAGCL